MAPSAAWWKKARDILGERVISDPDLLEPYGHDESAPEEARMRPEAVVRPRDEGEVSAVLKLCGEERIPVTVRGAGTGLSAGCVPSPGGIVLSTELMNRVIEADPDNHTITVQSGVPLRRLYEEVQRMGLYFPPHPGDESAHVGGAVAANAGGSRAVKYGTVRRFVLGLQVVLASGEILDLGGKYIKSSTGYHLADLMIGSEGTLGVLTRVTLSLLPPVGSVQTMLAPFRTVESAIGAVPPVLAAGVIPCAVEFVEHSVILLAERLLNKSWPSHEGAASLMLILDGRNEEDTLAQAEAVGAALESAGAMDVLLTGQKDRQAEMLELRSMLYEAIRPGTAEAFDVCVPRSEIAPHVGFVHRLEEEWGTPIPTYGHAADGNVHSHTLRRSLENGVFGEEVPGWPERSVAIRRSLYEDVVRRGGVISGEHGVGTLKKDYLPMNIGPAQVAVMRSIRKALDPDGILNPGKIFDA
ncbi:MAG: FAD-binding oxidoreductase [Spirochaetia bacterium]